MVIFLAMLNERHPALKLHALSNLNSFMDYFLAGDIYIYSDYIPVVMGFAVPDRPQEVRVEAAYFLQQLCQLSDNPEIQWRKDRLQEHRSMEARQGTTDGFLGVGSGTDGETTRMGGEVQV